MKLNYKGDFEIFFNGKKIEMEIEAQARYDFEVPSFDSPGGEDFEVEELTIKNAHYEDGSLVDPALIDEAVCEELNGFQGWKSPESEVEE